MKVWQGATAIVGAADLVSPSGDLEMPARTAEVTAIKHALDDAGLALSDVDGLATSSQHGMGAVELAEFLRIRPRWLDSTWTGGSAPEVQLEHAVLAVASGACDVAVLSFGSCPSERIRAAAGSSGGAFASFARVGEAAEWELPYGIGMPVVPYALAASRHMSEYGTTREQLAAIAVSTRRWAQMNPVARFQKPLTIEDVLAAPPVAEPLHRYDCCLFTDGAGAVVVTRTDRARDLRRPPVLVLGTGTSMTHAMTVSQQPDLTRSPSAASGALAFARAAIGPGEVDVLQLYDSFTITVLLALEDLGFCVKGEGGAFVADGRLAPGGELPTNTSGGGLSYTHPGAFGMFLLVEAVRQLRGDCGLRQVEGASLAIAHGCGGFLSCTGTVVLGTAE